MLSGTTDNHRVGVVTRGRFTFMTAFADDPMLAHLCDQRIFFRIRSGWVCA